MMESILQFHCWPWSITILDKNVNPLLWKIWTKSRVMICAILWILLLVFAKSVIALVGTNMHLNWIDIHRQVQNVTNCDSLLKTSDWQLIKKNTYAATEAKHWEQCLNAESCLIKNSISSEAVGSSCVREMLYDIYWFYGLLKSSSGAYLWPLM